MATLSSSAASEIWVDPRDIRFKISPHCDLSGTKAGDWDIERRHLLTDAVKHRSIRQRYVEGRDWEDTDLFQEVYSRRLAKGESVRGERTHKGLVAQYYGRVDDLFAAMKRDGFQTIGALPLLLIGRDEVFIGNQGNHRLAIAQVLGLSKFAGKVLCRHPLSQR